MTYTLILTANGMGQSASIGKGFDVWNFILSKNDLSAATLRVALISFMYQGSVLKKNRPERTADPVLLSRDKRNNAWCLAPSSLKHLYIARARALSLSLSLSYVT
jgi:hypothetical protein